MRGQELQNMEIVHSCAVCRGTQIQQVDVEFNLCRCAVCGFIFDSPRPTAYEVRAFYARPDQYSSWLGAISARDALWKRRLRKMLLRRAPGNLLDVGAGIGQFLFHARPFFSEVRGTEISPSAIRIAKEKYGLDMDLGSLDGISLPPAGFDNITLFHVLEHVPDPRALLERCRTLLRPGGVLFIAVPNDVLAWGSLLKKMGKKLGLRPFQKFSPQLGISRAGASREIHLSHFTPATLRQILQACGFAVVEESIDPYYAARGPWRFLHGCYYACHQAILAVTKINRYETMGVVATVDHNAAANP
jgi:2-polyprenyl-3-methyl-5-hydroxy-6-metoxy-1,4-benzoquinol methylase